MLCASIEGIVRDGILEEDNEKFKTDKIYLCKPWWLRYLADMSVSSGRQTTPSNPVHLFKQSLRRGLQDLSSHHPRVGFENQNNLCRNLLVGS